MPEYYWTLIIETGFIQASIWTVEEGSANVISESDAIAWDGDEGLITAADTALSECIQTFPEETTEPSKTVFGVPASWVTEGSITPEHLDKIKSVCSKLSLQPAGFVVLSEAIAYWIKSEEESPLSAIILGLGRENIDVSLFRLGNLVGNVSVARSMSIVEDVLEGLARFPQDDNLPSRILLYNGKSSELELANDVLVQADWLGSLSHKAKFLHSPKIETITPKNKLKAVSLSGASEIAGATSLKKNQEQQSGDEQPTYLAEEVVNIETQTVDPKELGFSLGQDLTAEFGGPTPTTSVDNTLSDIDIDPVHTGYIPDQNNTSSALASKLNKFEGSLGMASGFFSKMFSKLHLPHFRKPTLKLSSLAQSAFPFQIGAAALVVVFVGLFLAWWFLPKADVVIYISPQKITKNVNIKIDTNGEEDLGQKVLAGKMLEKEISGEDSTTTTGTKTVGEKAHGKLQIRNGTSSAVKLTTTTVLVSSNNLRFNPESSASVSSATSPSSPGTVIIDVVAVDIGSEYNLAKDETFKIGNYPKAEVDGIAQIAFSGGSSRQIQAVSADDRSSLQDKLTEKIKNDGTQKIDSDIDSGEMLIPEATTIDIDDITFNHKVGDEAQELSLTLNSTVSAPSVSKQKLIEIAKTELAGDVPDGYILRDEQIENQFTFVEEEDGIIELEMTSTANLLPKLDVVEIAKKIKGKYPRNALEYLNSIAGFSKAEIDLKPNLPGKLGIIPRIQKNISIQITAER